MACGGMQRKTRRPCRMRQRGAPSRHAPNAETAENTAESAAALPAARGSTGAAPGQPDPQQPMHKCAALKPADRAPPAGMRL
jgi:hypothetical protein